MQDDVREGRHHRRRQRGAAATAGSAQQLCGCSVCPTFLPSPRCTFTGLVAHFNFHRWRQRQQAQLPWPPAGPAMSAPAACAFPLFRDRFLQPLAGGDGSGAPNRGFPASSAPASDPALSPTKAASRMGNLRVLDLRALPRDDGPPTELRARKEKLAHFERQCSRVGDGLYVGAEWVAKSREALAAAGITHVVNCVGFLYPPYFEAELAYQTLYLQGGCSAVNLLDGLLEVARLAWQWNNASQQQRACRQGPPTAAAGRASVTGSALSCRRDTTAAARRHARRGHPVRAVRRV